MISVVSESEYDYSDNKYMTVEVSPEGDHLLILVSIVDACGTDVVHARLSAGADTTKRELYDFLASRYTDVEACVVNGTKYFKKESI